MKGSLVNGITGGDGNLATLTKIDKLRELIGTKISLPQLVVVGDQSSGKSSVLENITGFAFPRAAELCTRYATQITCKREDYESVTVTIMPHEDADPAVAERLQKFTQTLPEAAEMNSKKLEEIFKDVNKELGISTGTRETSKIRTGNAFSEHMLRIEICGPDQEHFTVIDVPGIFRTEKEGETTESDIQLVKNMVMRHMKDPRTIILAIVPANVDQATQEIIRLAKQVDPLMNRTMAVLTKPDLVSEKHMQKIAIDLVTGDRSNLKLGYYIVMNRGSDDDGMTLEEGQKAETAFFSKEPWAALRRTGRAGIGALKTKARSLLSELIKEEFPKVRAEIQLELSSLNKIERGMGPPRSDPNSQRAYLGTLCDQFQAITRDALQANYTAHEFFSQRGSRLVTLMVELHEQFANGIRDKGHTREFVSKKKQWEGWGIAPFEPEEPSQPALLDSPSINHGGSWERLPMTPGSFGSDSSTETPKKLRRQQAKTLLEQMFPTITSLPRLPDSTMPQLTEARQLVEDGLYLVSGRGEIMSYIKKVYNESRGADLATFNSSVLAAVFQEQTKNWEQITSAYILIAIVLVQNFIEEAMREVCRGERIMTELWENHISDSVQACYGRVIEHTKFLLAIERKNMPFTLNTTFNDNLSQSQSERLLEAFKKVATSGAGGEDSVLTVTVGKLKNLSMHNQSNPDFMLEFIHDVLSSFYKVSIQRFVDNVCLQVVHHYLLFAEDGPLRVFSQRLLHGLDDEQLDQVAGESSAVRAQRDRLARDIAKFNEALDVLKGGPGASAKAKAAAKTARALSDEEWL